VEKSVVNGTIFPGVKFLDIFAQGHGTQLQPSQTGGIFAGNNTHQKSRARAGLWNGSSLALKADSET